MLKEVELRRFDFKVPKTKDCVLIDIASWVSTSNIVIQKISGKLSPTYITTALEVNAVSPHYNSCQVLKNDMIFLSKAASEVALMRSYTLTGTNQYYNAPLSQIMGVFDRGNVSLDALRMVYDKILVRRLNVEGTLLDLPETADMIGEVIKVGTNSFDKNNNSRPLKVKEGDVVLIKDNVCTPIRLDGSLYYALEERSVVGIFDGTLSLDGINFINESILMQHYYPKKVLNSSILEAPEINYEDLDYSDIYNRDLFKVIYADERLKDIKPDDIVLVKRDYTVYVYMNHEKYFLLNGMDWVEAKINEKEI